MMLLIEFENGPNVNHAEDLIKNYYCILKGIPNEHVVNFEYIYEPLLSIAADKLFVESREIQESVAIYIIKSRDSYSKGILTQLYIILNIYYDFYNQNKKINCEIYKNFQLPVNILLRNIFEDRNFSLPFFKDKYLVSFNRFMSFKVPFSLDCAKECLAKGIAYKRDVN